VIEQTERFPRGSVVRVDVSAGYGSLFVAGGQVVVDARAVRQAVDGTQSARMLSLLRTGRGLDVKLRRVVLRVVVVVEVEAVRDVVVEQRLRRSTQSPYSSNSNSNSGGFRGCGGSAAAPPLASFRKIQGLPVSKIVRTADSTIIIVTNFYLAASSHEIFLRVGGRGHEGAWGTPKAPAAAPPLQKSWIRHWTVTASLVHGERHTMSHIVNSWPQTKLEGGRQRLHSQGPYRQ